MMVIIPPQAIHVQRHPRGHGKAVKHVRDHLTAQVTNLFPLESKLSHAVGPRGDVDDGAREGFVEGCVAGAVALDALDGAEGLLEGLAERKGTIFGGVVVVDPEVAGAGEGEGHAAVLC